MSAIVRAWDRFWFRPEPTSTFALLRIAFGVLTVLRTLTLVPDVGAFFGPGGVGAGQRGAWFVIAFLLTAAVCLTIGFHTRSAAATVLVCLVLLYRADPLIWNAGDTLMRHLALFLALSPAGESLSVDRWRSTRTSFWEFPSRAPWALRLIQVQVALMYVATVVAKLRGSSWPHGVALSYVLRVHSEGRFLPPTTIGASPFWSHVLTWGTLAIEAAIPIFVWSRRTRPYVLALGVCLHLAIHLTLRVGFFSWTVLVAYLAFLPPDTASRLAQRLRWNRGAASPQPQAEATAVR